MQTGNTESQTQQEGVHGRSEEGKCAVQKYYVRNLSAEGPGKRLVQLRLAVRAVQPAFESQHNDTLLRHLFLVRRAGIATGLCTVCVWRPKNQRVQASTGRTRKPNKGQTVRELETACDSSAARVVRVVHDHGTGRGVELAAAARVVSFVYRQASACIPHLAVGAVELVEHPRVNTRKAETVGDDDGDDEPSRIIHFPVPVHDRRASAALHQLVRLHAFRILWAEREHHRRM